MATPSGSSAAVIHDDVLLVDVGSLRGHDLEKEVSLALLPQIEFSDEVVALLESSKPLLLAPLQVLDGQAPVPAQRTQLAKGTIQVRQDGSPSLTTLPVNPTIQQQVTQMSDDLHLAEASCLKYWILASQRETRHSVAQRNRLAKDTIQENVPRAAREFVLLEAGAALSALNQLCRARVDPALPTEKKETIVNYTNALVRDDLVGKLIRLLADVLPALLKRPAVHAAAMQWQKTIAEILFVVATSTHFVAAELKALLTLCKAYATRLDTARTHIATTLQSVMGLGSSLDDVPFDAKETASLLHTVNWLQATVAAVLVQDTRRFNRSTGDYGPAGPQPLLPSSSIQELNALVFDDKWLPASSMGKFQAVVGLYYALHLAKTQFNDPRVAAFHVECVRANCFSFLTHALLPFAPPRNDLLATPYYAVFQDVFVHYVAHYFSPSAMHIAAVATPADPVLSGPTTCGDGLQDLLDWATHLCDHCPALASRCWSTPLVDSFVHKIDLAANERARIAYMHFLAVSGKGNPAAAYKHIKDSPPPITWTRFFSAIESYRRLLMPDAHAATSASSSTAALPPNGKISHKFSALEVDALEAMFHIFQTMVQDEGIAHYFLDWPDVNVLLLFLGFVRCPIPSILKGAVMDTLASFVTSAPMGQLMWQHLESAQILITAPPAIGTTTTNQGILFELEQIESMQRKYPATLGFLHLLGKVFPFEFPDDVGASYRVPGAQPYLDFVLHVFLKADSREYDVELEKWQLLEQCLRLFDQVLGAYAITPSDFKDEYVVLNPQLGFNKNDKHYNKPKTLGFMLLTKLLTDSALLRKLLQLLTTELSVTHLDSTSDDTQVKYTSDLCLQLVQEVSLNATPLIAVQEHCVHLALNVLHRVLDVETSFVAAMRASALEIVVEPLHRLLGRTPQHVVTVAKYIGYAAHPSIPVLSAKIVRHLSAQLPPTQLVELFQDHGAAQDIRDGYVSVIMMDDATETKQVVLDLLVENVTKPVPNVATMLLMELQANNCLDALLLVLDNLNFVHTQPVLAERGHHLLYKVLSSPHLNVVGHLDGFFARQIQTLPTLSTIQRHLTAHRDVLALVDIRRWLLQDLALYLYQTKKAAPLFHTTPIVSTLVALLETTPFVHVPPPMPLEDVSLADQCTMEHDQRLYIDVVKFQSVLHTDDMSSPLLQWALSWNRYSERISVEARALDAWTALVQVLVVDPHQLQVRDLYQLWQALLAKAKTKDAVAHLVELLAKVTVTLSFQVRALRVHHSSLARASSSSSLSSYQRMELIQETLHLVCHTLYTTGNPAAARRARCWFYTSFLHLVRYGHEDATVESAAATADALGHLVLVAQEPTTLLDQFTWSEAFLTVVCRDATEATEPLSMGLAMNVLSLILGGSSSGRAQLLRVLPSVMPHLCSVLFQLRQNNQDGLVDNVVSFFVQLAQTPDGALTLVHGGLLRTLMQVSTFPIQRPQWTHDMESWLAAEQAYYEKWLPVLRLVGAVAASLPHNTEAIQAIVVFLHKHMKLVSGALTLEVHYPSLQRLVEMAAVALLLRLAAAHAPLLESLLGPPKVVKLTQKLVHVVSYYGRDLGAFTGWWHQVVPRTLSEHEQADVPTAAVTLPAVASVFDQLKWDTARVLVAEATSFCRIRMLSHDSSIKMNKSDVLAIALLDAPQDWLTCLETYVALFRKDIETDTVLFLIENTVTVLGHHALHNHDAATAAAILSTLGSDFENYALIHLVCRKLRDMMQP
ncbi:Aste57867_11426 [Aphanomyces stellatus]|uniref:Aste57867_11426 protein n=1 Tax=Aphanomyces stellatus TaxID=120398 RepID=A0A485KTD4_9STRA|nr:hypothetical protein As57867_011384 [Aphanomyces stellatus]VFT88287.1 Aste57867_11426 [Aphanomyces stellatus]